ncbi:MAG: penicillin-binding protein 2 [Campylobacterota bacterium]|nr:penicillin-binding protein 2 [Campylobacterota bacterium]
MNNKTKNRRGKKVNLLFIFLLIAVLLFLFSIFKTITSDRRIPSYSSTIHDRSFRGSIISADKYTLSSSEKSYKAIIRGSSIHPDKKEVFIKLFSIYSGIDEKEISKKFTLKGKAVLGNITLSDNISSKSAMQLKSLAYKFRKLGIFQWVKNRKGIDVLFGLDIIENGESRRFPLKDILSPIVGYVGDQCDGKYSRPEGMKGLERHYEKHITSKKNGYFKGKRDVAANVIHDKNSIKIQRIDGMDLHLNIPLDFQRRVELMIDQMKQSIDAQEIIVGVMESHTGKVLSLASSERYNPAKISQKDIPALNPKFSEYPHEAGSVIKPLTLAIALDHDVVTPQTWFNTHNGRFRIGKKHTITDDHKFASLTASDIIVHSSNIGSSQISWRLTGKKFREGLLKFGIAKPTGIDLSRDLPGSLKPIHKLKHKMHRANSSYGYGMMVTFAQIFKAYSAFNNDGVIVTPRIVDYLQDAKGRHYTLEPKVGNTLAVSKKTANQIQKILVDVVKHGTGVKAQYAGLEIGGKTGTAHIAKNGKYVNEYHSSFYGFANDNKGNRYTIGVLVIKAKKHKKYFASQSAVPTFKHIVHTLVDLNYLTPDSNITEKLQPILPQEIDSQLDDVPPEAVSIEAPASTAQKSAIKELFNMKKKPYIKPKPIVVQPTLEDENYDDLF